MAFQENTSVYFDVNGFAESAVYNPHVGAPVNTTVIVIRNTAAFPLDFASHVKERQHQLWCKFTDIPKPKRGETIVVGTTTYTVEDVDDDDGVVVKVRVK